MSTVVLYCWCHSDSASVLLYFTLSALRRSMGSAIVTKLVLLTGLKVQPPNSLQQLCNKKDTRLKFCNLYFPHAEKVYRPLGAEYKLIPNSVESCYKNIN